MVKTTRMVAIVSGLIVFLFTFIPAEAGSCFYYSDDVGYVCDGRFEPAVHQFEEPLLPEESLLDHATYAYMEDNINIYPEPDLATAPVYNVGEGFLYVTIHGEVQANGHKWYEVNPGQYALAEDIRLVETPDFNGVVVNVQPERPFGWIVQEIRPSNEPDGEPNPDLEKLERFDFIQIYDALRGLRNKEIIDLSNSDIKQMIKLAINSGLLTRSTRGSHAYYQIDPSRTFEVDVEALAAEQAT